MITQQSTWRRLSRTALSALLILSINSSLLLFTSCSGKKQPTTITETDTTGLDGTGTGNTGSLDGTGTTSNIPGSNTQSGNILGGNQSQLFDTDLDGTETSQFGNSQLTSGGQPSRPEQACLTNGYGGNGYGGEYGSNFDGEEGYGNQGYNQACVNPQQSGAQYGLSEESFYNSATSSYNLLDYCLEQALSRYPQSDQEAQQAHMAGRMFLTRCYQRVVRQMQRFLPWGNYANSNYNRSYNNLGVILIQFRYMND